MCQSLRITKIGEKFLLLALYFNQIKQSDQLVEGEKIQVLPFLKQLTLGTGSTMLMSRAVTAWTMDSQ